MNDSPPDISSESVISAVPVPGARAVSDHSMMVAMRTATVSPNGISDTSACEGSSKSDNYYGYGAGHNPTQVDTARQQPRHLTSPPLIGVVGNVSTNNVAPVGLGPTPYGLGNFAQPTTTVTGVQRRFTPATMPRFPGNTMATQQLPFLHSQTMPPSFEIQARQTPTLPGTSRHFSNPQSSHFIQERQHESIPKMSGPEQGSGASKGSDGWKATNTESMHGPVFVRRPRRRTIEKGPGLVTASIVMQSEHADCLNAGRWGLRTTYVLCYCPRCAPAQTSVFIAGLNVAPAFEQITAAKVAEFFGKFGHIMELNFRKLSRCCIIW